MLNMKAKYLLEQEQEWTGLALGVDKNRTMTFGVQNKLFFCEIFFIANLNFNINFKLL